MASNVEIGHAKNVANFEELITIVAGYGKDYNPTKKSIKTDALLSVSTYAKESLAAVNLALPADSNAVAARDVTFDPLKKLATRLLNALKATDATKQVLDNAKTLVRKLQGKRASPKKTEEEKKALIDKGIKVNEISSSQVGFENQVENFDKLIKLLASIELYNPNEEDLKISSLIALYNDLKEKNAVAVATKVPLANARIYRNKILYKDNSGLYYVAADVKTYVKSLYGARSPQYKLLSKLKFTKIKS